MLKKHGDEINQSIAEIAKYNATDNWKNYNNSELDVFGLNSQMARSNNLMITMDNQLVIMSSVVT